MSNLSRQELFRLASVRMVAEFEELRAVPHRGAKGAEAESLLRDFLNGHLPRRFAAGKGFILDQKNQHSKQTDIVIYDALNCPIYRVSDEAAVFPANNVAAVIEVKSVLDKQKLEEAAENIAQAKSLMKHRLPVKAPFHLEQTLGLVFAFESSLTLEKIGEHYRDLISKHGLGPHIDFVVVLGQGIVTLATKIPGHPNWGTAIWEGTPQNAEGTHLCVAIDEFGTNTLDFFVRILLTQLQFYPNRMDHPGFDFTTEAGAPLMRKLTYLALICLETDPTLKAQLLQKYRLQVMADLMGPPPPGMMWISRLKVWVVESRNS